MTVLQSGAVETTFGNPRTVTFSALTAGSRLIICATDQNFVQTISGITTNGSGTPAMTLDHSGNTAMTMYSITAQGGETSVTITFSGSVIARVQYIEDNQVPSTSYIDQTIAYAASGEATATLHRYDFTGGASAGLVVAMATAGATRLWGGSDGSTPLASDALESIASVFKDELVAGVQDLEYTFDTAITSSAMLVVYNYASASTATTAWLTA